MTATTMNTTPATLPVVTVQHTFPEVIKDVEDGIVPEDKFWVSCYKTGEPSVHAKIHAELDDRRRDLVNLSSMEGDVQISGDRGKYTIACPPLGVPPTRIVTPVQEYIDSERANPQRPQRITAFAVSPDTTRFATGFLDGTVLLYPSSSSPPTSSLIPQKINSAKDKITARPQVSSVTSLRFFPSSRVLLSAGADFALSILPADLSSEVTRVAPVRVMRAHTRAITSTAILGAGRNVLSSSLDASIKLWDVPSGSVISTLPASSSILCTSLAPSSSFPSISSTQNLPTTTPDPREVPETQTHTLFAGLASGSFDLFDLRTKSRVSTYSPTSSSPTAITAINFSSAAHLLATGSKDGLVRLFDARGDLGVPVEMWKRLEASVEDLDFFSPGAGQEMRLGIATSDGLPYIVRVSNPGQGVGVNAELIGADCDPVRHVSVRGGGQEEEVWTASDDGVVRRYLV